MFVETRRKANDIAIALTGKDKALYEKSVVSHAGTERIIRRGRDNGAYLSLMISGIL